MFGKNVAGWIEDQRHHHRRVGTDNHSRDMARFGFLYLNRGTWESTPVIPKHGSTSPRRRMRMDTGTGGSEERTRASHVRRRVGRHLICCVGKDLVVSIASR